MACIELPPPPPPGPPAPAPSPVPAPPPAVGLPPSTPPGTPQIVMDIASSYILPDCGASVTFPEVNSVYGMQCNNYATFNVVLQNLSSTDAGTVSVQVSTDHTSIDVIPSGIQTVTVTPGNVQIVGFAIGSYLIDAGLIIVTIDIGGSKTRINLVRSHATNSFDCGGGGGGGD